MRHVLSMSVVLSFLVVAALPQGLSGQTFGNAQPGQDEASVGVLFGHFAPQTTYRDGSTLDSSTAFGLVATWWAHRHIGLNGGVAFTETAGVAPDDELSIVTGEDPEQILFNLDALLRYPLEMQESLSVSPYIAVGPAWKRYSFQSLNSKPEMRFGASYAAGAEVRFGAQNRFGLRGEVREFRSNFERWGEDVTQHDRSFTAGVVVNL